MPKPKHGPQTICDKDWTWEKLYSLQEAGDNAYFVVFFVFWPEKCN